MGSPSGGVAAVVAIAGGTVLAIGVALALGGKSTTDYVEGTYVFNVPASDYADATTVLVQGGLVTDVWISDESRTTLSYGYTPQTPGDMLYEGSNTEITKGDDDVTMCDRFEGGGENCNTFEHVAPLSSADARAMSFWEGLPTGTHTLTSRSVTWELSDTTQAQVRSGLITRTSPTDGLMTNLDTGSLEEAGGTFVRYWVRGEGEPFAFCHDIPEGSDEEVCYTW